MEPTEGLYTIRHVQGFSPDGPLYATSHGVDEPITVEKKSSNGQKWGLVKKGDKWLILGSPLGSPEAAKPSSGTLPVLFGFHNDKVFNGSIITLSNPIEYTISPRGDNIYTILPADHPKGYGVDWLVGTEDNVVKIQSVVVNQQAVFLTPLWILTKVEE